MERPIVGGDAYRFLCENDRAELLGVYHAGSYLRVANDLLLLCDRTRGLVPFGVSLADYPALFTALAGHDEVVHIDRADGITLRFGDLTLPLGAVAPDPRRCRIDRLPTRETLAAVAAAVAARGGLAPLCGRLLGKEPTPDNAPLARALSLVPAIADALFAGEKPNVAPLVGLGYGLTPSGDDLLAGMLYAAHYFTPLAPLAPRLFAAVAEAEGATNLISRRYLAAARAGARFDAVADLCEALAAPGDPANNAAGNTPAAPGADAAASAPLPPAVAAALDRLLAVGASSGGDIATGLLTLLWRAV